MARQWIESKNGTPFLEGEGKREREREMCVYIYIYIHTHVYIYIYIVFLVLQFSQKGTKKTTTCFGQSRPTELHSAKQDTSSDIEDGMDGAAWYTVSKLIEGIKK